MTAGRRSATFSRHETQAELALDGTPLASFAQRLAGYLIDLVGAVIIWAPLEAGWRILLLKQSDVRLVWDFHEAGNIVVLLLYHGAFNYFTNGRTPGKWIAGTRIVSLNGPRMGAWQSLERALGYGAAILEFGLGFLQFFWSPNRMCAQDRLAETIVTDVRTGRTRP